ncbi:hypothetical protein GCM10010145_02240 [Streptomyces ruber]|uniref:XRE family transcriptional regulator n=2 Tax=Streptomyces TaxID=1883 RepID=A0A918B6P9_9ACTN|nr:helix-turn-helix domain-containing protein [Streptomyces ruber]GGQ38467.1 hypothetical protein GCM10010145_02240 [Streptomyces ruber]
MGNTGELGPARAGDAGEFVEALRQLKKRSGLTYRQLEERAAERGEVLPRSTLADVLRGRTLPRPELLAAFLRACGEGERVPEWLETRERLARERSTEREAGPTDTEEPEDSRPPARTRPPLRARTVYLLVTVAVVAVVGAAVRAWIPSGGDDTALPDLSGGPVQIRPVSADGLCVTDGMSSRYGSYVAVQRPCGDVAPQETRLVPLGGNAYRIQWYRPDQGTGCLIVLTEGSAAGLLEPRNDCERQSSRFRIEPVASEEGDRVSIRVDGQGCLAIAGSDPSEGAEVVMEPCRDTDNQVFAVTPAP